MVATQAVGEDTSVVQERARRARPLRWWERAESEEVEWYVAVGHDLVMRSPVGYQLECARDQCRVDPLPSSKPKWSHDDAARAAHIAARLVRAEQLFPGAVRVLWALCHPIAVSLDSLPRARLVAVYGLTETGSRARWSAAGYAKAAKSTWRLDVCELSSPRIFAFNGERPGEVLRSIHANVRQARGRMAEFWDQVHREAEELAEMASRAYVAAGDDE